MPEITNNGDARGGYLIALPGVTSEQIMEGLNRHCPKCGCCLGTHWPGCSLEDRKPIVIDMSPRTVEEACKMRGIPVA